MEWYKESFESFCLEFLSCTLGARGFSCAVSGVDRRSEAKYFRPLRARRNLWFLGYLSCGMVLSSEIQPFPDSLETFSENSLPGVGPRNQFWLNEKRPRSTWPTLHELLEPNVLSHMSRPLAHYLSIVC